MNTSARTNALRPVSSIMPPAAEMPLPYSHDLEESVIGGLLVDNQKWQEVAAIVSPDDFYSKPCREIYTAIIDLLGKGIPADVATVQDELEQKDRMAPIGGFAYLVEVAKNCPSAANVTAYATRVTEYAEERRLKLDLAAALSGDTEALDRVRAHPYSHRVQLPISKGFDGYNMTQSYVIKNYLPENSLTAIYGTSGSYKSFLALSWACHIATGQPWNNSRVIQGSVLYVVGEGGIGVPRRVKAWADSYNQGENPAFLYRVNCPVFFADPQQVYELEQAAKRIEKESRLPLKLIIVDTLARCFGGGDENRASDMGAFIQGCDKVKANTGATVLVVHHSGKDEDRGARGSTAFRAALDAEYMVKREGEGGALVLRCTKMKDCEEPEQQAFDLKSLPVFIDDDGDELTSLVLVDAGRKPAEEIPEELSGVNRLTGNHMMVWQAIRSRTANAEPCTRAVLRDDLKAMGAGFATIKNLTRTLDKLVTDGLISFDGEQITPISHTSDTIPQPQSEPLSELM